MSLKIAIFEDDKELADVLKDIMEMRKFSVDSFYSLKDQEWEKADVVLADYRNKIVPFNHVMENCKKLRIPLIAISGAETGYLPQVLKPFSTEELESAILKEMMLAEKVREKSKEGFSISRIFGKD